MKKISSLLVTLVLLLGISCQQNQSNSESNIKDTETKAVSKTAAVQMADRIEVLDFYGTHRCKTCRAIEANSRYTLDTYFAQAMKDGKITFQVFNADEAQNAEIAEKFEATGTSLFLNVVNGGNETIIELTDFAFAKGNDQEAFSKGLKNRIEEQLQKF